MVERLAESSQCYKAGEGEYNQWKFEDSWLIPGVLVKKICSLHGRVISQLKNAQPEVLYLVGLLKEGLLYCRKIKVKVILQVITDL